MATRSSMTRQRLHVEEAHLEVGAARTHRREERGQVLGHVAGLGEDAWPAAAKSRTPRPGRRRCSRRPSKAVRLGSTRQPGREPGLRAGAARVRRGQQRAGQVEQPPLLEAGRARPPVQAELGRRRAPHHRAPGRADAVEVALHRQVARRGQLEGDLGATPGIDRRGVEADPGPLAVRAQRGHRHPQLRGRGRAGSAGKAELDLAAGLEREVGGVLGVAGGLADPLDRHRRTGAELGGDELVLDADATSVRGPVPGNSRATCRRICLVFMALLIM